MTLDDIYQQLSFGELRQLFMGGKNIDDPNTGMPEESFYKLLPTIQLGLTEMHKRFNLRLGYFNVNLQDGQVIYQLLHKFAASNSRSKELVKYIDDSEFKFYNNLLKVECMEGVLDEEKYEIPMNEAGNDEAIMFLSDTTFKIPTDEEKAPWLTETTSIKVTYRANHPEINTYIANVSPKTTEIYLPHTHLEALCYYVASRMYNPIGMVPNSIHQGNNYFAKFEASCLKIQDRGFEIDDDELSSKFGARGFC